MSTCVLSNRATYNIQPIPSDPRHIHLAYTGPWGGRHVSTRLAAGHLALTLLRADIAKKAKSPNPAEIQDTQAYLYALAGAVSDEALIQVTNEPVNRPRLFLLDRALEQPAVRADRRALGYSL